MKPTVEEQLQGTCRILESVVRPCVVDPLAVTTLDGLIANLRMLAGAVAGVAGFLRGDNQATARLLTTLRGSMPDVLSAQLARVLHELEPDPTDAAALDERNRRLREILAEAVCGAGLSPDQHEDIVRHMTQRASRVPMRYVATAPAPTPAPAPAAET